VGKGNLIFRNKGKQVYTVGRRKDGKAVRAALKYEIMSGANQGESREKRIQRILNTEVEELFDIREVKIDLPKRAVIFKSVRRSQCGEGVMESKAHLKEGKPLCPDCFEDYTRGW